MDASQLLHESIYDNLLEYSVNEDGTQRDIHDSSSYNSTLDTHVSWLRKGYENVTLCFYVLAFLFDFMYFLVQVPIYSPSGPTLDGKNGLFGWHFVHLTYWGGLTQCFYFFVCILDTVNREKIWWKNVFHKHRDRYFTTAFAVGLLIGLGFWTLIFPHEISSLTLTKFYMDFAAHGCTTIFICTELFLVYHKYGRFTEAIIPWLYLCVYCAWNVLCHHISHHWAYPNVQDSIKPAIVEYFVYILAPLLAIPAYDSGRRLTAFYWNAEKKQHTITPMATMNNIV